MACALDRKTERLVYSVRAMVSTLDRKMTIRNWLFFFLIVGKFVVENCQVWRNVVNFVKNELFSATCLDWLSLRSVES